MGHYTAAINLLDLCAIALPAGYRRNKTGFGISLIGSAFHDAAMIELAERYMALTSDPAPPLDLTPRPETVRLAVVGAHLQGMPLHWELTTRSARFVEATRTAPAYRLYAMTETVPPKPALVHAGAGGNMIDIEIYELDLAEFGSFVANVPAPLAIGTVALENGESVKGFVAEPRAIEGALDVTQYGGWRAYRANAG
jgi:allophanate hydrolase